MARADIRAIASPSPTPWCVRVLRASPCSSGAKIRWGATSGSMPGSVVDHADLGASLLGRRPDQDLVVLRRERERVLDQLLQDPARGRRGSGWPWPARAAPRSGRGRRRWRPRGRRRVTSAHSVSPASTAASNRCDQPREVARPVRPAAPAARRAAPRASVPAASVCAMPEDHRDRRAQLVAQPRDQLVAAGGPLQQRLLRHLELAGAAALPLERLGQLLDHRRG